MSQVVTYAREGSVGVITVNNPPVNALSQAVRQGLKDCLAEGQADADAKVLLILGAGRTFIAGADIREFGKPPQEPNLPAVIDTMEQSDKVVVAAIHGTALGGGLEVCLGTHYRVAVPSGKVGLPEVKLGLLPGAGGTQRLPRLTGPAAALEIMTSGRFVSANEALKLGIIDAIAEQEDVREAGLAYANKLATEGAKPRRVSELTDKLAAARNDRSVFEQARTTLEKTHRGQFSPFRIVDCVEAAVDLPFADGMKKERELFKQCMESPQRAGLIHAFFSEREAAKLPDVSKDTPRREVKSVGVIGAGTMGGGIAMNFVNVGIPVKILEVKQDALDKGLAVIRRNYENTAKKGRISMDDVEKRMGLIQGTLSYDDLSDVDLVIEAVFESMDIKKKVFGELDRVCKPGAILATNTSTLDVDEIAASTKRPEDVVGMHFFSPANVMKLLENVRGEKTAKDVIATVMDLSKRIQKVGVCVGVCHGFVGNRMLHKRQAEAMALVNEGATPWQVDKVIYDFGFPMGPFAMSDLAGLDVGYRIREELRKAGDPKAQKPTWTDKLVEQGRHGQKTGAGVYLYEEGNRKGKPDPEVEKLIDDYRKEQGISPREVSDEEILERNIYIMINEGAKILEEGIALRSSDIDVIYLYGYGFPAYRGGPMFYADSVGVKTVYDRIVEFQKQYGDDWKPAPLLEKLAREGGKFGDL
ncbi:MAG: enoyl-CoA hydratase/isomerase family protein [Ectothiorhodospiraceae bacterium]|nr:enoyl-CoA hydratase/isomerase family protein [Ectothiorhodospiraceae bacterium]